MDYKTFEVECSKCHCTIQALGKLGFAIAQCKCGNIETLCPTCKKHITHPTENGMECDNECLSKNLVNHGENHNGY